MSVQTQIDRIEAAKEAIATAITGKGVTVPDGTLIDGMAALIDNIEAGSGGSGGASVETCTIVFDSKYNDYLVCYPACLTIFEDGVAKPLVLQGWWESPNDMTINNVICGSPIVFAGIYNLYKYSDGLNGGVSVSGGVSIERIDESNKYIVFRAPTDVGATGTIWFNVK